MGLTAPLPYKGPPPPPGEPMGPAGSTGTSGNAGSSGLSGRTDRVSPPEQKPWDFTVPEFDSTFEVPL